MPPENAAVAVCNGAAEAEAAVSELRQQGLGADCISIVAVDEPSGLMPVAYYFDGGRLRSTAASGGSLSHGVFQLALVRVEAGVTMGSNGCRTSVGTARVRRPLGSPGILGQIMLPFPKTPRGSC
jgi:hypothetical protein